MPLPVVTDTWLVRLLFTGSPLQRTATVNLHFRDTVGTQTAADLFADLDASALANMWNLVSSNVGVTGVSVTKLDGTSASVGFGIAAFPAKWTGSGGADAVLGGAAVVSLKSALRGPKWRNRVYLPAIAEASQSDGTFDATKVANSTVAWAAFAASMLAAGWESVVVSPTEELAVTTTSLQVRPFVRSQRRRNRR